MSTLLVRRRWWPAGIAALLVLAVAAQSWRLDRAQSALERAQAANVAQVSEYRQVAAQAQADAEHARAEALATQQRISDAISTDYEGRLASLRARYDSLRRNAATADPSGGGRCHLPGVSDPAGQSDAAACNAGFLAILQAADENTERLISLQEWVRGQMGSNP